MKKTIIYIIIAVLLIAGAYHLWQNRHDYFFQGEEPYEVENQQEKANQDKEEADDQEDESGEDQDGGEHGDEADSSGNQSEDDLQDILNNHCVNRCEGKKGTDDYDYCMNICGFEDSKQYVEDDCSSIENRFERDACYKQKAIEEENAGVCDQIEDKRLRKNCQDRVVEELFN